MANDYVDPSMPNYDSFTLHANDKNRTFEEKIKAKSEAMLARKRSQNR